MRPPITILMTTWAPAGEEGEKRAAAAEAAVASWGQHLEYDGEVRLHVADDGSSLPGYAVSVDTPPATWWPSPVSFSRQEARGVGASINAGWDHIKQAGGLCLYLVDDWLALAPFDLRPWADLLQDETMGMVMFGPPYAGVVGRVEMHTKTNALWIGSRPDPHNQLYMLRPSSNVNAVIYAQRPALYHPRFWQRWGPMLEDVGAVCAEETYNERWRASGGDDIVLSLYQPFRHIEGTEFGIIHPPARRVA